MQFIKISILFCGSFLLFYVLFIAFYYYHQEYIHMQQFYGS